MDIPPVTKLGAVQGGGDGGKGVPSPVAWEHIDGITSMGA